MGWLFPPKIQGLWPTQFAFYTAILSGDANWPNPLSDGLCMSFRLRLGDSDLLWFTKNLPRNPLHAGAVSSVTWFLWN